MIEEQVCSGDAFRFVALSAVTHIQNQLLRAFFLQRLDFAGNFLGLALGESIDANLADAVLHHLVLRGGNVDNVASDHNLLRFGTACAHDGKIDVRARLA